MPVSLHSKEPHKTVELLAPAGSFDCLQAAIRAGADAVYFGVEHLNMRSQSANGSFALEDIKTVAERCHENGIRAYLTLNTVMYDHDFQMVRSIVKKVQDHGIDAVIASDMAVIDYCNELRIPVHISTQANVSNLRAVEWYSRYADTIVLARELTLKQIEEITREIQRKSIMGFSGRPLQIEVFIHGALCMAVSGQCYLSLHSHKASANRGACMQNCRRRYEVRDADHDLEFVLENEYIMSPKDLCTIDILDQILQSGVSVLKIEGRSKAADYVYTVTRCYREAIDSVLENRYTPEKIHAWQKVLATVYNRGFWEGHYLGRKLGEWTSAPGSMATVKKVYLGKGSKYYPKIGVAEFLIESGSIKPGDALMIMGPQIGMARETPDVLMVNGLPGEQAVQGDKITFPFTEKIGRQDKLYKIVDA